MRPAAERREQPPAFFDQASEGAQSAFGRTRRHGGEGEWKPRRSGSHDNQDEHQDLSSCREFQLAAMIFEGGIIRARVVVRRHRDRAEAERGAAAEVAVSSSCAGARLAEEERECDQGQADRDVEVRVQLRPLRTDHTAEEHVSSTATKASRTKLAPAA